MTMNDHPVSSTQVDGPSETLSEPSQMLMSTSYRKQNFLRALFRALDEHEVRYCVLHTWKGLPEELPSDLDLAVHPSDRIQLAAVFGALEAQGFLPVQCLNYAVNGYTFVFQWFNALVLNSVAVDIVFEYRESGMILASAKRLVAGRRHHGEFWIPEPTAALYYLLAKKTLKGDVRPHQQQQLKDLIEEMGRSQAEEVVADLYGEKWKNRVVDACLTYSLPQILRQLAVPLRRRSTLRKPLSPIRYVVEDSVRLIKRVFHPTGVFAVVLGPDGVGKSTLVGQLLQAFGPALTRRRVFHFRPQLIGRQKETGLPSNEPHADPVRGTLGSVARLAAFFLDYWMGYLLVIRPLLARSGLIIFDRYFHDIMIDSKRYRYGGPLWLPHLLSRIVPPPDLLFLVLDADIEVILSRKREVDPEDLKRLRTSYINLTLNRSHAGLIKTDESIEQSTAAAVRNIALYMAKRFRQRHGSWLMYNRTACNEKPAEVTDH